MVAVFPPENLLHRVASQKVVMSVVPPPEKLPLHRISSQFSQCRSLLQHPRVSLSSHKPLTTSPAPFKVWVFETIYSGVLHNFLFQWHILFLCSRVPWILHWSYFRNLMKHQRVGVNWVDINLSVWYELYLIPINSLFQVIVSITFGRFLIEIYIPVKEIHLK